MNVCPEIEEPAYNTWYEYVTVGENVRIRNVNSANNYHRPFRSVVTTVRYKPSALFNCYILQQRLSLETSYSVSFLRYKIFPSIRQSQITMRC